MQDDSPSRSCTRAAIRSSSRSRQDSESRAQSLADGVRPSQDGTAVAKDVFMLGSGLAIAADSVVNRPGKRRKAAKKRANLIADAREANVQAIREAKDEKVAAIFAARDQQTKALREAREELAKLRKKA